MYQTPASSDSREPLYPSVNIQSATQKEAIAKALINPLILKDYIAFAFRIVWRQNEQGRDYFWKHILANRVRCDKMVKGIPGVSMVLSCITGAVSRPPKPKLPITYPAISYWVATKDYDINVRQIMIQLQGIMQGEAEVKLLKEPPLLTNQETMSPALFTSMKDHGNGFVKRKMVESYATLKLTMAVEMDQVVRILLVGAGLSDLAKEAKVICQDANVLIDIDE